MKRELDWHRSRGRPARRRSTRNDFETTDQLIVLLGPAARHGFESLPDGPQRVSRAAVILHPAAEELASIQPLETWRLEQARTTSPTEATLSAAGLDYVTVNVARRQLMQQNFFGWSSRPSRRSELQAVRPPPPRVTETVSHGISPNEAVKRSASWRSSARRSSGRLRDAATRPETTWPKLPVDVLKITAVREEPPAADRPAIVETSGASANAQDGRRRRRNRAGSTGP